jgi:hypothetical protein
MGALRSGHTAVEHETFPLYVARSKGEFVDMTVANGLAKTKEMSGWGNGIVDFDNDGWKDLFVARSNVMDTSQNRFRPAAIRNRTRFSGISGTLNSRM